MKLLNIIVCLLIGYQFNYLYGVSNIADQRFLDNADQFSDEYGVQLYNGNTSNQDSLTPEQYQYNLDEYMQIKMMQKNNTGYRYDSDIPISKKKDRTNSTKKSKVANYGVSFTKMASITKKSARPEKEKQSSQGGFTFSQMAKVAQKNVSPNRK